VLAVAAAFVAPWVPGRDGQQLRFVQRLTSQRSRSADELGSPVADHDDGGVRSPTGERGQHRAVDHP
jgi:hypothetical protein